MRNIQISVLLLFVTTTICAQINHEETYVGSAGLSQIANNEFNYYYFDVNTYNCVVRNINHQLVKSIAIPLGANETLASITYLSKYLFDTDDEMELIYTYSYWYQSDTSWFLSYHSKVLNEDGSILLDMPGAQYFDVINYNTGSKLMNWIYDFSLSSYPVETNVYSLPGTYNNIKEGLLDQSYHAYPNPCEQSIYLPLRDGVHSLQILNSNGQTIDHIHTGKQDLISFNVNELSPGVYFARQTTQSGDVFIEKFIIR
jgi:hypothetical protein